MNEPRGGLCENPKVPRIQVFPPSLRYIDANDCHLAVWEWPGEGPPLLFAHGTSFHGRCWDQVIARLGGYHCFALDARGHGLSSKPDPPYHWNAFARDLAAIAEQLGIEDGVGIGHSMGGFTSVSAAALRPQTYSALLLLDPTIRRPESYGISPIDASFIRRRKNRFASPDELFANLCGRAPFDRWDPEVLKDYCRYGLLCENGECVLACPPEVEASIYEASREREVDLSSICPTIHQPVTILRAGTQAVRLFSDDPSPTDPELAKRFPNGRDVFLSTHSHFIPMESPDLVAEHIQQILRS